MPEPKKKDKYVLLDDDSECETEEFNKMKMSWMDTRSVKDGKKYTTCRAGRCSAWCQPQWICHTIFIFVLLVSQVFLFLYVLRQQWELEILKLERGVSKPQEAIHQFDKQLYNEINKVEGNANIASDPEEPHDKKVNIMQGSIIHIRENLNLMQAKCEELTRNVEDKSTNNQEFSRLYKLVWKLNVSTVSSTLEIKDEIHELRNLTAELTQQFRSMETNLHSLRDLTNTQVTELEQFEESLERMHNVSENLKSHQSQLEQDLDSNFQQISQLKDEIYQKEDALNQTSQPSATMAQLQIESTPYTLPQQLESSKVTSLMSHEVDGKLDVQTPPTENTSLKSVLRNIISIPSITNLKALKSFFYGADWTGHGYLTYRDLVNTLGRWAPTEENIKQFDENNDDRFSYTEMIKALGLQE
ncbi:uncharacterized protein LOC125464332 isoform X4 [Stegostoma tigrinum]|uniref:uncharacterized protein LOC125464332 isoform X4 n=1 Tax=Stegostoma tigrinum TaxID=3053191 RepID=UPI00202B67CE|nr:uncharacterized protein LOC125464332 isoform X4 [Stegostoma tigrinum]